MHTWSHGASFTARQALVITLHNMLLLGSLEHAPRKILKNDVLRIACEKIFVYLLSINIAIVQHLIIVLWDT